MPKKLRYEHGPIIGGRLQLDREYREVIRAYTRMKLLQARLEVDRAKAAHDRMQTQQSAGRLAYAEHVYVFLQGLYSQGQHSVDPALWAEAWRYTTTDERHAGIGAPDTSRTIPGME